MMMRPFVVCAALALLALLGCKDDPLFFGDPDTGSSDAADSEASGEDERDGVDDSDVGGDTGDEDAEDGDAEESEGDADPDAADTDDDSGEEDCGTPGAPPCVVEGLCPGYDEEKCRAACADGVEYVEVFGEGAFFGCAGSVTWKNRSSLCGEGYYPVSAQEWVELRNGASPGFHYWTNEELGFGGEGTGDCSAGSTLSRSSHQSCAAAPMRVCSPGDGGFEVEDFLGNVCTWVECGWKDSGANHDFGGCNWVLVAGDAESNPGVLAGTLCIARDMAWELTAPMDGSDGIMDQLVFWGNIYSVTQSDVVLESFSHPLGADEDCVVQSYFWQRLPNRDGDFDPWELVAAKESIPTNGVSEWFGIEGIHHELVPGSQVALGIGWGGCLAKSFPVKVNLQDPHWGVFLNIRMLDVNFQAPIGLDYSPPEPERQSGRYVQRIVSYRR